MNRFRTIVWLSLILTAAAVPQAGATNGHQLSAVGAYQQSMGGAVTAAPYDATAAISNPAGMALIGTRTDFSFEIFMPKRELTFPGGEKLESGSSLYLVPAFGWTAPANERGNLFFGGGMYGVSGMGVDYSTSSTGLHVFSLYQFWKMAPTLAWKGSTVALGISLNLDYQAFGFKMTQAGGGIDLSEMQSALGGGAAVGILYQPVPAFGLGLTYTSRQYFRDFEWYLDNGDINLPGFASQPGVYRLKMDFPQQAAVGIAVRLGRPVLWTLDTKWINYKATHDELKVKGAFGGGATELPLTFGWDDVWVYATGLQFDITPNFVFRLGYNHSTSPIKKEDVENNLAFPAIVTDRASGGFTYRFGRNWETTLAYMKAFREELTGVSGTTISLEEQAVDVEISYRF